MASDDTPTSVPETAPDGKEGKPMTIEERKELVARERAAAKAKRAMLDAMTDEQFFAYCNRSGAR